MKLRKQQRARMTIPDYVLITFAIWGMISIGMQVYYLYTYFFITSKVEPWWETKIDLLETENSNLQKEINSLKSDRDEFINLIINKLKKLT